MLVLLMLIPALLGAVADSGKRPMCKGQGMAKYNMTFETFWTEERFPKQFPTFRPHAQWSKLIGE